MDGVTIQIVTSLIPKVEEINKWWMEITGYELERTDYKKIIFSSVNDYIAIKTNGGIKQKGDYITDFEIYKNKSARIIPIALKEYFVNNVPVEDTIKRHTNIYDFCIRQKASRDFHYEGINRSTGEKTIYNKLIRYYVSHQGEKVFKIKNPECQTNAAKSSQVEAGEWLCRVCNYLPKSTVVNEAGVNFDYYIEKTNNIIYKVEFNKKKKVNITDPSQLSLF